VSDDPDALLPLLTPAAVRQIAERMDVRPTKVLGQNFVHDANTVRRIVRSAALEPADVIMEVGPGLGSLTLALLDTGSPVLAVEIDPVLAEALPGTVAQMRPQHEGSLAVLNQDALHLTKDGITAACECAGFSRLPTALVANLPYNVAVPVLLTVLERFSTVARVLVMVQAEVADRLAAKPGNKTYGAPSVKAAWYGRVERAGGIPRQVFWPVPNVESGLVRLTRTDDAPASRYDQEMRAKVFAVIDQAFAQRRKMLRSALSRHWGGSARVESALVAASIAPTVRGETVDIEGYVRLTQALDEVEKS